MARAIKKNVQEQARSDVRERAVKKRVLEAVP